MYYNLFFKYSAIKDAMGRTTEVLGLRTKLKVKGLWAESFFSSSISLSMREKAQNIRAIKVAVKGSTRT